MNHESKKNITALHATLEKIEVVATAYKDYSARAEANDRAILETQIDPDDTAGVRAASDRNALVDIYKKQLSRFDETMGQLVLSMEAPAEALRLQIQTDAADERETLAKRIAT